MEVGTLAIDGWAVMFGTAWRGLGRAVARPVGCCILWSEEGPGRGRSPPRPILAVPNVTAQPSSASVPITALLYDGPLLCGFNVAIKGLRAAYEM